MPTDHLNNRPMGDCCCHITPKPLILLTGGTGFVGAPTAHRLIQAGFRVRALARPTSDRTRLPAKAQPIIGHLLNYQSLQEAVKDCWGVIHVAGAVKVDKPRDFYRVNRDGSANLVRAAAEAGVVRFVLCSSQAAAGPSPDIHPVKPEDPPHPITEYGRSKLAGEQVLQENAGAVWWSVIRPPAVYGPFDTAFLPLARAVKHGFKFRIGKGSKFSLIYVEDLAEALTLMLVAGTPSGEIHYATDGAEHTVEELADSLEKALGKTARWIKIPVSAANGAALVNETLAKLFNKTPFFNRQKILELTQPVWTCDDSSLRQSVGYREKYNLQQGMAQTIRWYKQKGWL
ncbi:MAG: NAD(P)-dependent oxidoreductase [Calditrichota bacterium]